MRTTRITLSALLLAGALSVAATAQPPAPALMQPALNAAIAVGVGFHGTVGVDFFYSNLAPYGYWVNRPSYGWVWTPRHIRHGWRPYSAGRWAYTDYGWTWVSSEPYGWATYHYGRWNLDPDYGWEWVPGTDWGPAWVSWQEGDGYCGWAPLPPAVGWSAGVGFGGFDLGVGIDPGWYNFVPERSFLAVNVGGFVVPPYRNVEIFRNTTNITNFRDVGGRVFNGSMSVQRASQVTGQPVRQLQLANASDPRVARVSGNSVAMFRPAAVVRQANAPDPARVAPRSVATGRVAQQLVQQRRSEAAQFRTAGNAGSKGQAQRSANANARAAQNPAGRNAAGMTPASRARQQAQARHQAAPSGRQQQQALGRNGHGQVTASQQRTRGGMQPQRTGQAQARHQSAPAGRQSPQPLGRNSRSQVTPQQQRAQGGTRARAQQSHSYTPPPQHQQAQLRRQSAPSPQFQQRSAPAPQRQAQLSRQPAPPQRPAQFQQQGPPPQAQRQAAPPPRQAPQAPQARPAPAPRQQQQRRQQNPPPPSGGA